MYGARQEQSLRPTVGSMVTILRTESTKQRMYGGIGKQFVISKDDKDSQPFQVFGQQGDEYLFEADVRVPYQLFEETRMHMHARTCLLKYLQLPTAGTDTAEACRVRVDECYMMSSFHL